VSWDDFTRTLSDAVQEYNTRGDRRMEVADGRSIADVWAEEWPRTVVRRLSERQAALLLLAAEDPAVSGDGTFALKAGRAGKLRNRYRSPALLDWSGKQIVARFDPHNLHRPVQVHDTEGRWICEAECHMPVAFDDAAAAKALERMRRRERRNAERAIAERADMDALRAHLDALPPRKAPVLPAPAAVREIAGLPELPHGGPGVRPPAPRRPAASGRSAARAAKIRFYQQEDDT